MINEKPTIYNEPTIYNTGAGGGGGGEIITASIDIENFDTTNLTDGLFYFDTNNSNNTISKIDGKLRFYGMFFLKIINTDVSKLTEIEIVVNNSSYGDNVYAGYNVMFCGGTGQYFTNYGVWQLFAEHVLTEDTHGLTLNHTGTYQGVQQKRFANYSANFPATFKNVINGNKNSFYVNDTIVYNCEYDKPQNELSLYGPKKTNRQLYDNFARIGTDSYMTSFIEISRITVKFKS